MFNRVHLVTCAYFSHCATLASSALWQHVYNHHLLPFVVDQSNTRIHIQNDRPTHSYMFVGKCCFSNILYPDILLSAKSKSSYISMFLFLVCSS